MLWTAATLLSLWSLAAGVVPTSLGLLFADDGSTARQVLTELRLPRVVVAWLAGTALAVAGTTTQALFRNPLADPGLIGVSGGAALAASVALSGLGLLGQRESIGAPLTAVAALVGGLAAAFAAVGLASRRGGDLMFLLLAGLAINAIAGAGIALLQSVVEPDRLRLMIHWLFGSLGRAQWMELLWAGPGIVAGVAYLTRHHRELDLLLLGQREAQLAGLEAETLQRRLLIAAVLVQALCVALCGIIGFIGLLVPHAMRLLLGPSHRTLIPVAALAGICLILCADVLSRTLAAPREIPIGVLTACLGGPAFLLMLWRGALSGSRVSC